MVWRGSSSLSFELETIGLLRVMFSMLLYEDGAYDDKNVPLVRDMLFRLDVIKEMNHRLTYKNAMENYFNPR